MVGGNLKTLVCNLAEDFTPKCIYVFTSLIDDLKLFVEIIIGKKYVG